ncbi:integrase [Janthinobacterium sp. CG_S6]|nr:integrase [Janthinobacterium sp. CG_S6]
MELKHIVPLAVETAMRRSEILGIRWEDVDIERRSIFLNKTKNGMSRTAHGASFDDRAGNKATIITSQLPVEHWHAWIGDATIADAVLDRIMQRNHRFTLTGDSLRAERPKTVKKERNIDPS